MPAFFKSNVRDFLKKDPLSIAGEVNLATRHSVSSLRRATVISWERTISVLKRTFSELLAKLPEAGDWGLLLEYEIPRRDRRIDVVLLTGSAVLVVEFKSESGDSLAARRQAEHYALDLRDFHRRSYGLPIVPIAVTGKAPVFQEPDSISKGQLVSAPLLTNESSLVGAILHAVRRHPAVSAKAPGLDLWNNSDYEPIPNIIEAAQMLFAGHSVRELSHAHAGSYNLTKTTDVLVAAVERAQREERKLICFVTGVPGAGKTLVGLQLVHSRDLMHGNRPAGAFLSGNLPLVAVISEALARDHHVRTNESLTESRRRIKSFVQPVQGFLKEYRENRKLPPERVIVFDEAQRAWDAEKVRRDFLQKAIADERDALTTMNSEPALVLEIMDRHPGWAVIIALVGGGQEIFDGEAGLAEWGRVLGKQFPSWQIAASSEALNGGPTVAGTALFKANEAKPSEVLLEPYLHLSVSRRSFRADAVAEWVNCVLNGQAEEANRTAQKCLEFPIRMTRSIEAARSWLRRSTRGLKRCGLLASSGALRLRAHGLEVSSSFRKGISRENWFLAEPDDIRSSNFLEIALTEFECQGLELDWVGLCWGGDFTRSDNTWNFRRLIGPNWQQIRISATQEFTRNKYRVLLTRAREGLVIWVPEGDTKDQSRDAVSLDSTADYLKSCGCTDLDT